MCEGRIYLPFIRIDYSLASSFPVFHDTFNLWITCLNLSFSIISQKWIEQVFQLFTKRKTKIQDHRVPWLKAFTMPLPKYLLTQDHSHNCVLLQELNGKHDKERKKKKKQSFRRCYSNIPKWECLCLSHYCTFRNTLSLIDRRSWGVNTQQHYCDTNKPF